MNGSWPCSLNQRLGWQVVWRTAELPLSCPWLDTSSGAFDYLMHSQTLVDGPRSLGDRHGENILFDSITGDTVHVDFNCLFDKVGIASSELFHGDKHEHVLVGKNI